MKIRKLNLGSGYDYRDGFVNVDFDKSLKADMYFDLRMPFPLKDGKFDEVLAQDVLEHFTQEDSHQFLREAHRILKKDGKIEVRVPNVYQIFDQFYSSPEVLMKFLYGNTEKGELGAHKYGFTEEILENLFKFHEFRNVSIKKENTNFILTANKADTIKKKINILISLQDSGGFGGAEVFLSSLGEELNKSNNIIYLVTENNKDVLKLLQYKKVIKTQVRMDITGKFKGLIKFFAFLATSAFEYIKILKSQDLVILSGISDKIVITPIAKLMGVKVIWIEFASPHKILTRNLYIPYAFYYLVKYLANRVIVPTSITKRHLIDRLKISDSKIQVIPCGIKPINVRKTNNQYKNNFVIGLVSRLEYGKGQDTIIKTASILKSKIKNLKVVLIGEGNDIYRLQKLTSDLELENIVDFLGYQENALELASNFDIFMFPSRWELEGFGLVSLEAMDLGVPLITSNLGPIPEVVGYGGVTCDDKPEYYAEEVYKIYKNKNVRKKIIYLGKERVKEFYISNIAKQYENICNYINSQ